MVGKKRKEKRNEEVRYMGGGKNKKIKKEGERERERIKNGNRRRRGGKLERKVF